VSDKKVHLRIKSGKLSVKPDRVLIKTGKSEQVIWHGHGGRIQIDFDKPEGSPFSLNTFRAANETPKRSGLAVVQPVPKRYFAYTATLILPNGDELRKDPGVDVDGGGDPGGRKKAAKKAARKKAARRPRKTARKKVAKKAARKRATRKKK